MNNVLQISDYKSDTSAVNVDKLAKLQNKYVEARRDVYSSIINFADDYPILADDGEESRNQSNKMGVIANKVKIMKVRREAVKNYEKYGSETERFGTGIQYVLEHKETGTRFVVTLGYFRMLRKYSLSGRNMKNGRLCHIPLKNTEKYKIIKSTKLKTNK